MKIWYVKVNSIFHTCFILSSSLSPSLHLYLVIFLCFVVFVIYIYFFCIFLVIHLTYFSFFLSFPSLFFPYRPFHLSVIFLFFIPPIPLSSFCNTIYEESYLWFRKKWTHGALPWIRRLDRKVNFFGKMRLQDCIFFHCS